MASAIGMASSRMVLLSRPARCQKAPSMMPTNSMLGSTPLLASRPQTSIARVERRMAPIVASSSDSLAWNLEGHGLDSKSDYSGLLAVAGFAATHLYSKFTVSSSLFLQTVAILQLVVGVVSIITRKGDADAVATVVGPAVLAVYVLGLSQFTYMQAAVALFGYYLAENLEGPTTVPFWVWGATLAAALYAGYGTEWYVAGWALLTASRLVRGFQAKVVPMFNLPILAVCGYALYKETTLSLTLLFFLGQVAWSGVKVVDVLTTRAS